MNTYKPLVRIAADIIMILLLAWAPLWLVVICAVAFAWFFAPYYENIAWGIGYDALYGLHFFFGIITAFVLFVIIELLKKKTRI